MLKSAEQSKIFELRIASFSALGHFLFQRRKACFCLPSLSAHQASVGLSALEARTILGGWNVMNFIALGQDHPCTSRIHVSSCDMREME